jgi:hypothetical protein
MLHTGFVGGQRGRKSCTAFDAVQYPFFPASAGIENTAAETGEI